MRATADVTGSEGVRRRLLGRGPVELRRARLRRECARERERAVVFDVEGRASIGRRVDGVDDVAGAAVVDADRGGRDTRLVWQQRLLVDGDVAPRNAHERRVPEHAPWRSRTGRQVAHDRPARAAIQIRDHRPRYVDTLDLLVPRAAERRRRLTDRTGEERRLDLVVGHVLARLGVAASLDFDGERNVGRGRGKGGLDLLAPVQYPSAPERIDGLDVERPAAVDSDVETAQRVRCRPCDPAAGERRPRDVLGIWNEWLGGHGERAPGLRSGRQPGTPIAAASVSATGRLHAAAPARVNVRTARRARFSDTRVLAPGS